jgi:hypothetical protein
MVGPTPQMVEVSADTIGASTRWCLPPRLLVLLRCICIFDRLKAKELHEVRDVQRGAKGVMELRLINTSRQTVVWYVRK